MEKIKKDCKVRVVAMLVVLIFTINTKIEAVELCDKAILRVPMRYGGTQADISNIELLSRDLLSRGSVIIETEDGQKIEFRLTIKGKKKDWYTIEVYNNESYEQGYFDFKLGWAAYGYYRNSPDDFAIFVNHYTAYKGIARGMVSLALALSKDKGFSYFDVQSSTADSFWLGLGFERLEIINQTL